MKPNVGSIVELTMVMSRPWRSMMACQYGSDAPPSGSTPIATPASRIAAMSMTSPRSSTYGPTRSSCRVVGAFSAAVAAIRRTPAFAAASSSFARSWIQRVTPVSAGPPCGGLYLNPPSSGGLCDGVTMIPSASRSLPAVVPGQDGARNDRRRREAAFPLDDRLDAVGRRGPRAPSTGPARRARACPGPCRGARRCPADAGSRRSPG